MKRAALKLFLFLKKILCSHIYNKKIKPEIFCIETVLGCNLKCPACAIGAGMITRKKGVMSLHDYKIILQKAKPYAKYFYLHLWGEPLLNNEILEMIKLASAIAPVNISTNALVLTDDKAEQLILSGVESIIVSIDGVSQSVYEQYRVGGNAEKAIYYLKKLNSFNKKHDAGVKIIPQFCVFKHNEHEMGAFRNLCSENELPQPVFKAPYVRLNDGLQSSLLPEYQRNKNTSPGQRINMIKKCLSPYKDFTILLDGTVVLCCYDHDGITQMGNIFKNDVLEIYNNEKYKNIRKVFLEKGCPKFCQDNCLLY